VAEYAVALAKRLGVRGPSLENIRRGAILHDIGKIGISDVLLLKRGPLNAREWAIMKQHCVIGESVLREDSKVKRAFLEWRGGQFSREGEGFANPLLELAASVALSHHEKWDGSGYPRGLRGEEIPIEARIVAIADVLDALTSPRPYRNAHAEKRSLEMVCNGAGRHFDPAVYAAFLQAWPEIQAIRAQFADPPPETPAVEERWNEESLACR
jgi:putative two-component system response regulator